MKVITPQGRRDATPEEIESMRAKHPKSMEERVLALEALHGI